MPVVRRQMAGQGAIKPGAENVYPGEVEKVIVEHPAVLETVVIGVPGPQWREAIKAVCVCKRDQQVTAAEPIEFVGGRVARYKNPSTWSSCLRRRRPPPAPSTDRR